MLIEFYDVIVGRFLELVKMQLSTEFPEVRGLGTDSLLYVKEDLIIPHVNMLCSLLVNQFMFSNIWFAAYIVL